MKQIAVESTRVSAMTTPSTKSPILKRLSFTSFKEELVLPRRVKSYECSQIESVEV